jgi:hypothetical protein
MLSLCMDELACQDRLQEVHIKVMSMYVDRPLSLQRGISPLAANREKWGLLAYG